MNLDAFKENLRKLRVRSNGRCHEKHYRSFNSNQENVDKLLTFAETLANKGLKPNSQRVYLVALTDFLEFIGDKTLTSLTRADLQAYFTNLRKLGLKETSYNTFNSRVFIFLSWLNNNQVPDFAKEFKPKRNKHYKLPDTRLIPTEDDVKRLIETASHPRDKALVSVLFETGMRVGELMGMKIGDLQSTDYGFKIIIDGKTGERPIFLINSAPYLRVWLNCHPKKADANAPIWVDVATNRPWNHGEPLEYCGVRGILSRLGKEAGIEGKKLNPHIFRHGRITLDAKIMNESLLRKKHGWTNDSNMASVYVHLNGKDVEDAVLKQNGKLPIEESRNNTLKPISCNRCQSQNPADASYCFVCSAPLNQQSFEEIEKLKAIIGSVLVKLLEKSDKANVAEIVAEIKRSS